MRLHVVGVKLAFGAGALATTGLRYGPVLASGQPSRLFYCYMFVPVGTIVETSYLKLVDGEVFAVLWRMRTKPRSFH